MPGRDDAVEAAAANVIYAGLPSMGPDRRAQADRMNRARKLAHDALVAARQVEATQLAPSDPARNKSAEKLAEALEERQQALEDITSLRGLLVEARRWVPEEAQPLQETIDHLLEEISPERLAEQWQRFTRQVQAL